jgi:hypothetical protein
MVGTTLNLSDFENIRELIAEGWYAQDIAARIGFGLRALEANCKAMGIAGLKRRPKGQVSPAVAIAREIESTVDLLRQHYAPVHAERTVRRPTKPPAPYSRKTVFRVGMWHGIPADELPSMLPRHAQGAAA